MCAFTWLPSPSRNLPLVFCASSHAICAVIIGLRANAIAMPVEKCSDGAASDAAAMFIHGTCWPSVNSMPEKPAACVRRARSATWSQVVARVMTSNSMGLLLECADDQRTPPSDDYDASMPVYHSKGAPAY